jgi:hypothetical protein
VCVHREILVIQAAGEFQESQASQERMVVMESQGKVGIKEIEALLE